MSEMINTLLTRKLRDLAAALASAADEEETTRLWDAADRALEEHESEEDADVALPVLERSVAELRALIDGWDARTAPLPIADNAVLKRALKAYKKRLKLARLDDVSTAGRAPMSRGAESSIAGVKAPEQYPQEVWDELVRLGRLRDAGHGLYELTTS